VRRGRISGSRLPFNEPLKCLRLRESAANRRRDGVKLSEHLLDGLQRLHDTVTGATRLLKQSAALLLGVLHKGSRFAHHG
jgi:hypothetical protein